MISFKITLKNYLITCFVFFAFLAAISANADEEMISISKKDLNFLMTDLVEILTTKDINDFEMKIQNLSQDQLNLVREALLEKCNKDCQDWGVISKYYRDTEIEMSQLAKENPEAAHYAQLISTAIPTTLSGFLMRRFGAIRGLGILRQIGNKFLLATSGYLTIDEFIYQMKKRYKDLNAENPVMAKLVAGAGTIMAVGTVMIASMAVGYVIAKIGVMTVIFFAGGYLVIDYGREWLVQEEAALAAKSRDVLLYYEKIQRVLNKTIPVASSLK